MILIVKHDTYEDFYIFTDITKANEKVKNLIENDWNNLKTVMTKDEFDKEGKWYISREIEEGERIEGDIYICKLKKS